MGVEQQLWRAWTHRAIGQPSLVLGGVLEPAVAAAAAAAAAAAGGHDCAAPARASAPEALAETARTAWAAATVMSGRPCERGLATTAGAAHAAGMCALINSALMWSNETGGRARDGALAAPQRRRGGPELLLGRCHATFFSTYINAHSTALPCELAHGYIMQQQQQKNATEQAAVGARSAAGQLMGVACSPSLV